ncbi:MAG: hypothetical protein FWE85_02710 [Clostridiales bacterium]|nr:hypothetical protein [Clostridiales bacterium]
MMKTLFKRGVLMVVLALALAVIGGMIFRRARKNRGYIYLNPPDSLPAEEKDSPPRPE